MPRHAKRSTAMDGESDSGPRSPARVMQILETLAEEPRGMPLTQLSERLGIPKTSLLSQLRALGASGHVDVEGMRYVLGASTLRLGLLVAARATVAVAARPILQELMRSTQETALLAMLDVQSAEAVYVDRRDGVQLLRYSPEIGARRPLYCTAFGRALLAAQDEAFVQRYLAAHPLRKMTRHTITTQRVLREDLARVVALGVATSLEEHTPDAGAIAAPVLETGAEVRYAVGIALPVVRVGLRRSEMESAVVEAARKLAWTLGHEAASSAKG